MTVFPGAELYQPILLLLYMIWGLPLRTDQGFFHAALASPLIQLFDSAEPTHLAHGTPASLSVHASYLELSPCSLPKIL
ncbi:hypothetical protein EV401DRAFT_1925329 [Pisolithus croceorrhizus]|nr:hypothetical protein EV401DRAFT_1925329 [Pisolithus croceorrhizus]